MKNSNKVILLIKNLVNDKFEILYIKVFKIKEVKGVITLLELFNTKIYLRFYVSLLKKSILKYKNSYNIILLYLKRIRSKKNTK